MLFLARTALIRAKQTASAGGYYFTVTIGTPTDSMGAGIATASATLADSVGGDAFSWGMLKFGTWYIVTNAFGTSIDTGVSTASNDVINVAWNAGNLYLGINGTYRNSSGGSAGTSPTSPTFTGITGTVYPFGSANTTSNAVTLNPSATPPSGYSVWGGTWNASDKHANVVLTGSNLIANLSADGTARSVRGTVSYS